MSRVKVSTGSPFEEKMAYSRAIVDGNWVFVSGTTGYNYESMTISEDIAEQTEQCLLNIKKVLEEVDSGLDDVVRVMYIVANADEFELCWPALRKYFGDVKPAATMISAGMADPKMKIEIQVTALKQS